MARRNDFESVNLWSNFTNWPYENVDPLSFEYLNNKRMFFDNSLTRNIFLDKHLNNDLITQNLNKFVERDIFKNIRIKFNGDIRQPTKDVAFFNSAEAIKFYNKEIKKRYLLI